MYYFEAIYLSWLCRSDYSVIVNLQMDGKDLRLIKCRTLECKISRLMMKYIVMTTPDGQLLSHENQRNTTWHSRQVNIGWFFHLLIYLSHGIIQLCWHKWYKFIIFQSNFICYIYWKRHAAIKIDNKEFQSRELYSREVCLQTFFSLYSENISY